MEFYWKNNLVSSIWINLANKLFFIHTFGLVFHKKCGKDDPHKSPIQAVATVVTCSIEPGHPTLEEVME